MSRSRKTPERTCIGCSLTADKRALVRVVRATDGHVDVDPTGKANGRGAYVCARIECFDAAATRKRFDAALRVRLRTDDIDRLRRELEALLVDAQASPQGR